LNPGEQEDSPFSRTSLPNESRPLPPSRSDREDNRYSAFLDEGLFPKINESIGPPFPEGETRIRRHNLFRYPHFPWSPPKFGSKRKMF